MRNRKSRPVKYRSNAVANCGFGQKIPGEDIDIINDQEIQFSNLFTTGKTANHESIGKGTTKIHLHGKTVANYDNGVGTAKNVKTVKTKDCYGCDDNQCVSVSGTLALTFRANPTITLPSPSRYAHLRPCQIKRVEAWIQNVLLPHEKQHKAAFELYNGSVNKPFQLKICRSEWSSEILQPIHDTEETRRRTIADNASDALDPFHTNIDLDCEDKETSIGEKSNYTLNKSTIYN